MTQVLKQEKDYRVYSNFIDAIGAPDTKLLYSQSLRAYMRFIHVWTEEEGFSKQSYSKLIDMSNEEIFQNIKSFILDMRNRNLSTSSMNGAIAGIKFFYEMNDVETIPWKKLRRFKGEATEEHEDRAYTKEEIQTLLNNCDLRLKAAVLLLSSTGMRIGALNTLLKSHLDEVEDCYQISVYKGTKGRGKYVTFCTPEARKALEAYFQFREQYGEKITPESPVFRKQFNTDIPGGARHNIEGLRGNTLERYIWKYLVKAGLRKVDHVNKFNRKEVKANHGFRKFYDTSLERAKIQPTWVTKLVGQGGKELRGIYSRPDLINDLFQEYKKAIPLLTVDQTNILKKEVKEQKDQLNQIELLKLEHKQQMGLVMNELKQIRGELAKEEKERFEEFCKQMKLEWSLPEKVMKPIYEARRKVMEPMPWGIGEIDPVQE